MLLTLALANGVFIMKWKGFKIMRHENDHSAGAIENSGRVAHHIVLTTLHIRQRQLCFLPSDMMEKAVSEKKMRTQ